MRTQPDALTVIDYAEVPETALPNSVLRFLPRVVEDAYYLERTDRNRGWITKCEQAMLRASTIGIAGCGGMGGLLASLFVRLGVGEVRIADSEVFDTSNINRQFSAKRSTVGKSKALETARDTRAICDDSTLVVYPHGINETSVNHFLDGCDIICDEIEVLALDARILLHERARALGASLFNCNTVGFSTNLFLYTPQGMTMEEAVGINYEEAKRLRRAAQAGDTEAGLHIARSILRAVVPELPDYSPENNEVNQAEFYRRILEEQKAPIIATNPAMAGGFLADRVLLYLLRNSGVARAIAETPVMPGYLHFDAATMTAKIVTEGWVPHATPR